MANFIFTGFYISRLIMKINSINYLPKNININTYNKRSRQGYSNHNEISGFNKFSTPTFRSIPLDKLYAEYNWYINCDRVPAVNSFLKMEAPKSDMNYFLKEILNAKDRGYEFIDSIVSQLRNSTKILNGLKSKLGEDSGLLLTFIPDSPYFNAYTNYIETKLSNATNIFELLKIRPDWRGDVLIEKHKQIKRNNDFSIGNIPKQIPENHLNEIIEYLRDKMEIGIKLNKNIDNLVIDDKCYEFKFFTEGKSSKNVFGLFIPSDKKKYVIKMEEENKRSLDAPFALGTLAKIDGYLTANNSRNSAPLSYYDHKRNFSIYKYIEHSHIKGNPNDLQTIRKKLPDFKELGLDYNDTVGFKNFFELNENSLDTCWHMEGYNEAIPRLEWISVDNDHVTFANRLQPALINYHTVLPNAMQMFF